LKKFRFKLEAILKHRKRLEDEALRVLGAAQSEHQARVAAKYALIGEIERAMLRKENLGKNPVTINQFLLEQDFIDGGKMRVLIADRGIQRASRAVEKALRAYLDSRKQSQMIEKVREQHFAAFKKELARKEQSQLDDLTVMRTHLKQDESEDEVEAESVEREESA
jgi:flagellar FliJ protein